jgi:copper chaperone NosL
MLKLKLLILILLSSFLFACGTPEEAKIKHDPIAFETSDECHVCGMAITRFGGPKGQVFETRSKQIKKFCSTTELIFWYLQPENKSNVAEIYVHNMANTSWKKPDDTQLIAARDAFFVINSNMRGSMGKTLASFLSANDAAAFNRKHGGQVVTFNALSLALLSPSN